MSSKRTAAQGDAMDYQPPYRMRSIAKGAIWPALPPRQALPVHALLLQLEQSQWLTGEELEARQMMQLAALLRHAQRSVPFYRERLAPIAERLEREPLSPALFAELPLLTRAEIQSAGSELHSTDVPKSHGQVTSTMTSGSTGKPIEVLHSELFQAFWRAVTLRNHTWHRRDFEGSLAMIRGMSVGSAYPEGKRAENWGVPKMAGIESGPLLTLDINCTPEQQVDWLQRKNPDYFITHPTNLERVARYCLRERIALPRLREVMTVAEILTPEARVLARKAWDVPVADMYTSRDLGYMALQCPEQEHYHVMAETCRLEVLDPAGRPCGPGEVGRIVVTPLQEFAMPLIRYEIGDHAEVGEPCPCGRGLPVLKRILGRTQQMLALPDGSKRWTLLGQGDLDMLRGLGIEQFQFVQTAVETLEVRLAVPEPLTPEVESKVRDWVAETYGSHLEVELAYFDEIPRTKEGKFFEFMSEVRD